MIMAKTLQRLSWVEIVNKLLFLEIVVSIIRFQNPVILYFNTDKIQVKIKSQLSKTKAFLNMGFGSSGGKSFIPS